MNQVESKRASAPKGLRLSGQLMVVLMLVTVPTLVALGLVAIQRNRQALTVDAQHYHRVLAERAAASLDAVLVDRTTAMSAMAEVLASSQVATDEGRLELASALLRGSGLTEVMLYTADGARRGGIHLGDARAPMPELLPDALRRGGVTTGAVLQRATGPVLPLVVPAPASAAVPFFLYAEVPLAPLCALVASLGETPPLRDRDAVFVIDGRGTVVLRAEATAVGQPLEPGLLDALRPGGATAFTQPLAVSTEFEREGAPMLAALATLPARGWAVVVQEPRAHAYQTLGALQAAVASAVGLALVLALLVGTVGARRVARPLELLVDATRRIARREWTRVAGEVSRRGDEVGALAREVDAMSDELREGEARLVKETQARAALSRYLAADVVDAVVKDPSRLKLGGERRLVTVLFADVVGFTRLSEQLPPETIVAVLNEYFTFATEIVHRHGGMIDKFIGDCVMAVWGLPTAKPDDAQRALDAAEALRRWIDTGNRRWKQKYGVEVQLAMGLHTGPVVAGNVGSEKRMDYTVIGDTVNVAARLEASAAPGQILVSESTREAVGDAAALDALGERSLRGRSKTTMVYEVRS
ncbi:MAG: adenylate/guanylate cyclase domain-containing protein [Myxococcota bacterium]